MDRIYNVCSLGRESITLGYQMDHKARRIVIDCAEWLVEYPGARIEGIAIPPEGNGYAIVLTMDGERAIWEIEATDTAYAGRGQLQLKLVGVDGEVLHSANACTVVLPSAFAQAGGEPPEAVKPWMTRVEDDLAHAVRFDAKEQVLTPEEQARVRKRIGAGTGGGSDVEIDATLMIPGAAADAAAVGAKLDKLDEDIAAVVKESESEPDTQSTGLWVKPSSETLKIPQINDAAESEEDTWSSKKIASELKNAGGSTGGGAIWYGQGIPPEGYELGIYIESEGDA